MLQIGAGHRLASDPVLAAGQLSRIMALVVNGVGGLILIYSPAYIHRHFSDPDPGKERFFLFFMLLFPGAMNGLIFSNHLLWMLFFWEVTTVCSFALIATDRTAEAVDRALKALWMTMLGGLAFVCGTLLVYLYGGILRLDQLVSAGAASGPVLLGVALLCFAGLTKAAQVPFQGWLIGAMVAPAPVSALLHSSTMVNAGVFLILALRPAFTGTVLSQGLVLLGAVSFLGMGASAVAVRHAKRILACSTVLNLGLVVACAGLAAPAALNASALLIVFHAVSKALLFLAVGAAAQAAGAADLEEMRGLFRMLPSTAVFIAVGLLTMLLPPFGLMIGKWLVLRNAAGHPAALALLAVGTAFHLLIYARWAADIFWGGAADKTPKSASLPAAMRIPTVVLAAAAVASAPFAAMFFGGAGGIAPAVAGSGTFYREVFPEMFFFSAVFCFAVLAAALWAKRLPEAALRPPYCCGAEADADGPAGFKGPMNRLETAYVPNYYLAGVFGGKRATAWLNAAAAGIMGVMAVLILIGGAVP